MDPLEPAVVRRLGDKRRSQRRATIVVAASAFAVLAAVIPVTLTMTDDNKTVPAPLVTPTPTPTPTPTGTQLGLGNIPEDFPLDKGAPDYTGDGGELLGPDPQVETAVPAVCQVDPLGEGDALGRLGFSATGPEVADDRELRTFRTAAAAEAVMEAIRDELDGCSTWTGETVEHKVTAIDIDTGWESVTFSDTDLPSAEGLALGGSVYQVTRVGTAVLTVAHSGEVNADSAAEVARTTLTDGTRAVAPEMCEFTPDACGSGPAGTGEPRTITYPGDDDIDGVRISGPDDIGRLRNAPEDFKAFVLATITAISNDDSCTEGDPQGAAVIVHKISTAGYAVGSTAGCAGHSAIWAKRDGRWTEVMGSNEIWMCAELDREGIPLSFVTSCFDETTKRARFSGDFGPTTVDGLRLGMTRSEILATGATLETLVPGNPRACVAVYLPGRNPAEGGPDGYFSNTLGLSSILSAYDMGWRTPEGIAAGSTKKDVELAYPEIQAPEVAGARFRVALTSTTEYAFALSVTDGEVLEFQLRMNDRGCDGTDA